MSQAAGLSRLGSLALLDDDRYLRAAVGVITTVDNPTMLQWIRREALAKS
ncbi:hypothetical protein ACIBHX_44830 [Nonomuraea sp. NPDC050536]